MPAVSTISPASRPLATATHHRMRVHKPRYPVLMPSKSSTTRLLISSLLVLGLEPLRGWRRLAHCGQGVKACNCINPQPARTDQHPMQPAVKYIELYLGCRIQCGPPGLVYTTPASQSVDSRRFTPSNKQRSSRDGASNNSPGRLQCSGSRSKLLKKSGVIWRRSRHWRRRNSCCCVPWAAWLVEAGAEFGRRNGRRCC